MIKKREEKRIKIFAVVVTFVALIIIFTTVRAIIKPTPQNNELIYHTYYDETNSLATIHDFFMRNYVPVSGIQAFDGWQSDYVDSDYVVETAVDLPTEVVVVKEYVEVLPPMFELLGDNFRLTAYCPCHRCVGSNVNNQQRSSWGRIIAETASGAIATEGVTVAADISIIPFGSKIYIEGFGVRIVQDTGSGVIGNHIDIFFMNGVYPGGTNFFNHTNRRVWLIHEGTGWYDEMAD